MEIEKSDPGCGVKIKIVVAGGLLEPVSQI